MRWAGWVVAVVIAVAALVLYFKPEVIGVSPRLYSAKDRHGMAFIVDRGGQCRVAGGPETHIGFMGKKLLWKAINTCSPAGQSVVIELTVQNHTPNQCPDDPFVETTKTQTVPAWDGNTKTELTLTLKPAAQFPVADCNYKYRLHLQGNLASGIDPELDIWP